MTSFFNDRPTKVLLIDYEPAKCHTQTGWWCRVQRMTDSEQLYGGVIEFDSAWLSDHVGAFFDDDIPF